MKNKEEMDERLNNPRPLPGAFLARMRGQLGESGYAAFLRAMERPPVRGLRVNTLKTGMDAFKALSAFPLAPVPGVEEGCFLTGHVAHIGGHALHRAGLFYMQEPSAMLPVSLLGIQPGMCVLDLCAAPGGKAGQIAAFLAGEGLLIANEAVPARAKVLVHTLERLGVRNALVTSMRADALCTLLSGYFDAVLVDAPCSGEGMFRKEQQAVADWSEGHVAACAKRQADLLRCAARALRPGGRLVYSTCTYAPEENEGAVEALLACAPEFMLLRERRCYPHTGPGEGQYMALLQKEGGAPLRRRKAKLAPVSTPERALYEAFIARQMSLPPAGTPHLLQDGRMLLLPEELPEAFPRLRLLSAGVHAGDIKKGVFHPAHALCMAYGAPYFHAVRPLNEEERTVYFRGETLAGEGCGYVVLTVEGYPAGFGKLVNGVIKNLLPKGLRG